MYKAPATNNNSVYHHVPLHLHRWAQHFPVSTMLYGGYRGGILRYLEKKMTCYRYCLGLFFALWVPQSIAMEVMRCAIA